MCEVAKTGREIDSILARLLNHAFDGEESVRSQIGYSIYDIGSKEPVMVLSSIASYLSGNGGIKCTTQNGKIEDEHRVVLLKLLLQVLEDQSTLDAVSTIETNKVSSRHVLQQAEISFLPNFILFLAKQMVAAPDNAEQSMPCCSALSIIAGIDCSTVVDELLNLFPTGQQPNYYIIKAFADIASNHPIDFVLKMKEVIARMTPVMAGIKKGPLKWVFAAAYGRFSESMAHYQSARQESISQGNTDSRFHDEIHAASFEIHMASAFDIIMNSWIVEEKEAKVKFACYESLGHMCMLLDRSSLESRLPRLVNLYVKLYKQEKPQDHFPITHGFTSLIREGVKSNILMTNPQAGQPNAPTGPNATIANLIMSTLHPMIARPIDFSFPSTSKNLNELLRSFEILARWDLELVLQFVINRFQIKERDPRISSLIILRHYVNALDDLLEVDKKPVIMAAVLTLLGEQDLVVKKKIMQLNVRMANQRYMPIEGVRNLVKFILQQCSLQIEGEDRDGKLSPAASSAQANAPGAKEGASVLQIRNAGNHILGVMATKVPSSHSSLWPYVLELIIEPEFNRAALVMFKVLEHIATLKRSEGQPDYKINFEVEANMPTQHAIFVRMMILASEPHRRGDSGVILCRALNSICPILHPELGKYMDESSPALVAHLENNPSGADFNLTKWQDTLLKVWREAIANIENAKWLTDLMTALTDQFKLYKSDPSLTRCAYRYLGALLVRIESRTTLQTGLDFIFNTVNYSSDLERQGCAQALGLVASQHLDVVLPRLTEKITKKPEVKSSGFFSFGSSAPQQIDDKMASTIVLAYGYAAAYANPELMLSRLDVHILHNILPLFPPAPPADKKQAPPTPPVALTMLFKTSLIKCVELISKSVHPSRLPDNKKSWRLSQRDELMSGLTRILDSGKAGDKDDRKEVKGEYSQSNKEKEGPVPSQAFLELKLAGINAATTLTKLDPPISQTLRQKLCDVTLNLFSVYPAAGFRELKKE